MEDKKINTGIQNLDRDLRVFLDMAENEETFKDILLNISEIEAKLGNLKNIKEIFEKLKSKFPESALKLTVELSDQEKYQELIGKVTDEGKPYIQKAKEIIEKDLKKLINILSVIAENKPGQKIGSEDETDSLLTTISKISQIPGWVGESQSLFPVVTICMKDKGMKNLLTTTIDWNNLFFLVAAFAELARIQLENGLFLAEKGSIAKDALDKEDIADRILNAQATLEKIKSLAPKFGIDIEKIKK